MTKIILKQEIKKVIEDAPESVLSEVLEYLRQAQAKKIDLHKNLDNILQEDKKLLQRLAL